MPYDDELEVDMLLLDPSPWINTSAASSRVSELRYDHGNRAVQVRWKNDKNIGYVYGDCSYEQYRSFARAASRGKYINRALNDLPYRLMTEEEVSEPVKTSRRGISSRVRTQAKKP